MRRDVFLSIVRTLEARDEYFQYRKNGIDRPGLTPLQKCTVALQQLAYGTTADMFDEYFHVGRQLTASPDEDARDGARLSWNAREHRFLGKDVERAYTQGGLFYAQKHEAACKDVERAFGVLQSRWAIVKGPTRFWYKDVIADVMYACIILHNVIVEHEGGRVTDWGDDEDGSSSSRATPAHVRGLPMGFNEVLSRQASMRNQQDHAQLMNDMIEEVWKHNDH
ncbi:uncharacterized protein LOC125206223 [Salvia hispanica]|uniref:uncharacterized protein LOC125206223 n=1 Tax=Salvia hispanica TaxID=49212 RepID=UPI002009BDDC|nr:uncharacterized protein LOC125206223 [Salvia hispanica]